MQLIQTDNHFDYIITGTGCAGLSLLLHILQEPNLRDKSILLVDNSLKEKNDKTWCFWEKEIGFLENLVCHSWEELIFNTDTESLTLVIAPFKYKMIRSIDLYNYAKSRSLKKSKIKWLQADVTAVGNENGQAFATVNNITYYGKYVFNSIIFEKEQKAYQIDTCYKLLQHFKGWVIETNEPHFDDKKATFMDFRVDQKDGCAFVYALPLSPTKALVEYTFFNKELIPQEKYDDFLKQYLKNQLGINEYSILETENGVIPMTNHRFKKNEGNVINIGTAAGWTKGSSGFTFQFIQKNTFLMTESLVHNKAPIIKKSILENRYNLYDSTLLNVLYNNKMTGKDIFQQLFSKQKPSSIFRFLDNNSSMKEDIKIMSSVPLNIFLPAALKEIYHAVTKK